MRRRVPAEPSTARKSQFPTRREAGSTASHAAHSRGRARTGESRMSVGFARWTSFSSRWAAVLFLLLGFAASAQAQVISQAVGGVYIDTKGILRNSTEDDRGELRAWRQRA